MNDEVANVSYEDLPPEYKDLVDKMMQEFQYKCLEAFGKTRNKVFQKNPMPKVIVSGENASKEEDEGKEKQMLQEIIHQSVSAALINQSGVFINTLRNAMRDTMNGSLAQEGTTGPAFYHTGLSAGKKPIETIGPFNGPGGETIQTNTVQTPQKTMFTGQPSASQPITFSSPQIAPSAQRLARDMGEEAFKNYARQPVHSAYIPQGFHPVSDYTNNLTQHPGYQTISGGNHISMFPNQYGQTIGVGTDDMVSKIADVIQNQFGLKPKEESYMYRRPYPEWFDRVALPARYRVPDFSKFSGQDDVSTIEHIGRFLAQCGEAACEEALRVRFFPLSLSGSAFTWFASLPPNSIHGWADLEKKFHKYFYAGLHEMKLTDLTSLRQRNDESVQDYVQRFRDVKNRCFSVSLTDGQLAELAFQGLLPIIKEKFTSQEFESLGHLIQKVSAHESRFQELRREKYQRKVSNVWAYDSDSDEDQEVGLAEWTTNKKPVSCPWVKDAPEKYGFDITKADQIFDLLLQQGQIKLSPNHTIPSAEELKRRKYCKFHNSISHSTNECKVFRQQIQSAIEQGRIKFEAVKKPMKIDGHPFPASVNVVGVGLEKGKAKILTSAKAKESGSIDPKYQLSADELKESRKRAIQEDRCEQTYNSKDRVIERSHVTSQMLLSKYRRQQERNNHRWEEKTRWDVRENEGKQGDSHWRCPFFIYCWNEGLRLPSKEDCPECNNRYEEYRPIMRKSVHDRLIYQPIQDENQWCPSGLTKSQKRRVQRLRNKEIEEQSSNKNQVWRAKADSKKLSAEVGMVCFLPAEFRVDFNEDKENSEENIAQLTLQSQQAIFDKPKSHRHLKPLYVKGYIDGKPMTKMLVDGGAAVNLMPYTTYRKLGKGPNDLIKTDMMLRDFGGNASQTRGALNVELTIGTKTLPTTFFVIDGKGSYSLLLGRDWIHANCCVPSTMHQCLIQWQGDDTEIVQADTSVSVATADSIIWEFENIECLSGKFWEGDFIQVGDQGLKPIQAVGSESMF